ncbi:MAG TPA: SRPBCC domain-containing protein [Rhizomicrobium sp.]|nr:SRPBCC domain-containing protein [Rhizomicrobium sp.]
MTTRSVTHASFTISRRWNAAPTRVFDAFAQEEHKRQWFGRAPGGEVHEKSFDFREGGRETLAGRHANDMMTRFDCIYRDIIAPGAGEAGRIVYSYVMHLDGRKISVSHACIELTPDGTGTKLVLTEYGDYLDGYDDAGSREHGTNALMDRLGEFVGG